MNLPTSFDSALVWFRRDLRDYDHAALSAALSAAEKVYCTFVFDREILDLLPCKQDRRVQFIHSSLIELDAALQARGGGLLVLYGKAVDEIPALACRLGVQAVFANRDYEPYAKQRDQLVAERLAESAIRFTDLKDQVVFDGSEVLTKAGNSFSVFTPYCRACFQRLAMSGATPWNSEGQLAPLPFPLTLPSLAEIGFESIDLSCAGLHPGMSGARRTWLEFQDHLEHYARDRNFPAIRGTSGLSPHLRFGTISIRELVAVAWSLPSAETWLKELIWRDFYAQVLDHRPHIVSEPFKPEYKALQWEEWPEGLEAWKCGKTGYPLIDSAMRCLTKTGTIHNRLRMVIASFLCKDLGIDWRFGESHFADLLNDFDLASNNGGWQWAASTGCDAQPWFRIFNPITQSEKFDPDGQFIRQHLPELAHVPNRYIHAPWRMPLEQQEALGVIIGTNYPAPIVSHDLARQLTLARYGAIKKDRVSV